MAIHTKVAPKIWGMTPSEAKNKEICVRCKQPLFPFQTDYLNDRAERMPWKQEMDCYLAESVYRRYSVCFRCYEEGGFDSELNAHTERLNKQLREFDVSSFGARELFSLHLKVLDQLQKHKGLRLCNRSIGQFGEWLMIRKLDLLSADDSDKAFFDAKDRHGKKYLVRGSNETAYKRSWKFVIARDLMEQHFDFLLAVVLKDDGDVRYAAKVPHHVITRLAPYKKSEQGHVFALSGKSFSDPEIEDLTTVYGG